MKVTEVQIAHPHSGFLCRNLQHRDNLLGFYILTLVPGNINFEIKKLTSNYISKLRH